MILAAILLAGCAVPNTATVKQTSLLMGTVVEITVQHENPAIARKIINEAFAEGTRLQNLLSIYEKNSEVSMINRKAGIEEVKVSEEVFSLIEDAHSYSELTGGAFDITVGPLLELWGFTPSDAWKKSTRGSSQNRIDNLPEAILERDKERRMPDKSKLEKALSLVDYRDVRLSRSKSTVKLAKQGMKIDMGAIAKGYIVDRMVTVLEAGGIRRTLVNAGGDMYALAAPLGQKSWRVGIRDPRRSNAVIEVIEISNEAAATSGDYEKFFVIDGKRFSHIIDPRTGYPASGLASVTVIAKTAAEADALSTALFVMGEKEGRKLIKKMSGVRAIFLFRESSLAL
jgi:thiamine biosynthesis lipoprotein